MHKFQYKTGGLTTNRRASLSYNIIINFQCTNYLRYYIILISLDRKRKIRLYLISIGVVLVIVSFGFYYYTIALSQSLIENFWVPEDQFNKLSTNEILTRITQLGAFVDFIEYVSIYIYLYLYRYMRFKQYPSNID
jgi:hypothetical protein